MSLVTSDERRKLQAAVGPSQTVVASAIARLHLASPDPKAKKKNDPDSILRTFKNLSNEEWTTTNVVGALVLVIDRAVDACVFQIYDMNTMALRFSYELYLDITYEVLSNQFHSIEIEDAVAGFAFASGEEARQFLGKVMALRPTSKKNDGANVLKNQQKKKGFFGGFFGGGSSKNAGGRKDSIQIGNVKMVQHEQHVGVNADGTFDVDHLAPQWKQLFKQAGIRKKDLQNPEMAATIMSTIQQVERQQAVAELYQQTPEYQDYDDEEIEQAMEDMDEEDLESYARYEEELRQYYEELAAYEAEQAALAAWEEDNQDIMEQSRVQEEAQWEEENFDDLESEPDSVSGPSRGSTGKSKTPPPLPPRKALKKADKELKEREKEAKEQAKAAKQAERRLNEAVKSYRRSIRKAEKSPEELEYERAAEEARRVADEAKRAAEEAARERDTIMKEIEEMRKRNQEARAQLNTSTAGSRKSSKVGKGAGAADGGAPPVPSSKPPTVAPPPPPPLPTMPPSPPRMPELPPLPAKPTKPTAPKGAMPIAQLQKDLSQKKLRKNSQINDRSKPLTKAPPKNGLLGELESGVRLRPTRSPSKTGPLPDLKQMKPKAQNQLMAKLIETMNERRTAMNDSDSEDEWSD